MYGQNSTSFSLALAAALLVKAAATPATDYFAASAVASSLEGRRGGRSADLRAAF